jgi:hypothetical protein
MHLKPKKIPNPENCRASPPLAGDKTLPATLAQPRATEAVALHMSPLARHENKGAAIVIVLAFLVMITFVVTAFFSRATANRQIENSSTGGKKAALLARSAGDLIIADLRKEMILSSSTSVSGSYTWLTPTSGTSMVPARALNNSIQVADANFLNLVKQSGIASAGGLIPGATVPTTAPSLDGHKISGDRWSSPKLTGGTTGPVNFTDQQVPNWTLTTRSGVPVNQAWDPSFKNALTSNSNYVIGRFAFNVYDEGGLLDVNVAGFPASVVSGSDVSLKGSQGLVDLGLIPGLSNADAFVKNWRNLATGQNSADYLAYLGVGGSSNSSSGVVFGAGPKDGFLRSGTTTSANDNRLLSRQDLIRLASNGTLGITGTALPYLTTFSRSLNAPTYSPDPARPKVIDPQMATKGFDDAFNPGLLSSSSRVTTAFTRADGTQAVVGEPLLKHRFPLSRIGGIGYNGIVTTGNTTMLNGMPSPATAATIYRDFGLTWNSGVWTYNHGIVNRIYKLGEIAGLGREPDFFELLQASIATGSLGKGWRYNDQNSYYQILQIGANLLNQAAPDSYPRRISFNNGAVEIDGVANLPCISRVITKFDRDQPVVPSNASQWIGVAPGPVLIGPLGLWFQAEIWNPHKNAATPAGIGPTQFRFYATGSVEYWFFYNSISDTTNTPWTVSRTNVYSKVYTFPTATASSGIQFGLTKVPDCFATPTLLTPSNITSASDAHDNTTDIGDPTASPPVSGAPFVGLYTPGTLTLAPLNDPSEHYWSQHSTDQSFGGAAASAYTDSTHQPLTFILQYKDPNGNWVTYTSITNTTNQMGGNGGISRGGTTQGQIYKADPRSLRFGYCPIYNDFSATDAVGAGNTLHSNYSQPGWPGSNANWGGTSINSDTSLQGVGVSSYPGFVGDYYGYFAENDTTDHGSPAGQNYYQDPDGVLRPGNANRTYGSGADGEELQIPAASNRSRPTLLNRPFRSVAEMGYAFRDDPWRNIDFFSAKSADAALLDTFCIDEQAGSALTAGVLNLNTRQQPVLSAVVNGVLKDAALVSSTLSATDAASLASIIATTTGASPMMNRSELATKISPALTYSSSSDAAIKARRESAIRALADVGDTRTWNLLIDVIAQSGRFPASASAPDQFMVEGETRYWLHVAIDRFTGQVIDQSLEVVNE